MYAEPSMFPYIEQIKPIHGKICRMLSSVPGRQDKKVVIV